MKRMYNVDYGGAKPLYKGAKDRYRAGSTVRVFFDFIAADTTYKFFVDGQELSPGWSSEHGFILQFVMPDHDVRLTCLQKNTMLAQGMSPFEEEK